MPEIRRGSGKKGNGSGPSERMLDSQGIFRQRRISRLVHSKGSSLKAAETVLTHRRSIFFGFFRRVDWRRRKLSDGEHHVRVSADCRQHLPLAIGYSERSANCGLRLAELICRDTKLWESREVV